MGANGGGFSFKLMNAMADTLDGGSGPSPEAQAHQAAFSFARIVSVSHPAVEHCLKPWSMNKWSMNKRPLILLRKC